MGQDSSYSHLRDNKFSVKSTDFGARLIAWVHILDMLLISSVTLTNHLTSMPQFPYLLNGDNNGSTSSNSAGFVMGKSNHEKDTIPDLQRTPQVII